MSVDRPVRAAPQASMPRRRSRRRSTGQANAFAPPECPAAASHARQSCDLAISRRRAPRLRLQPWLPSQCRHQLRRRLRAAADAKAASVWADRPGRAAPGGHACHASELRQVQLRPSKELAPHDEDSARCCRDGSAGRRVCWVSAPVRSRSPARPIPGRRRDVPPLHTALHIEAPTPPMLPQTCPTLLDHTRGG